MLGAGSAGSVPTFPVLTQEAINGKLFHRSGDCEFLRTLTALLDACLRLLGSAGHAAMLGPLLRVAQANSMLTMQPAQLRATLECGPCLLPPQRLRQGPCACTTRQACYAGGCWWGSSQQPDRQPACAAAGCTAGLVTPAAISGPCTCLEPGCSSAASPLGSRHPCFDFATGHLQGMTSCHGRVH